ncbi:MAG: tripartite tricarboxylate transporter permease [Firmicutes bacterium]|nr:tripartite tricarboxylate transporter permease [Bacillota bacterium]
MITNIFLGLASAFSINNILFSIVGVFVGIVIGAIPGLGPAMGIAVTLPLTYGMEPASGMLLLMGIYCGAVYGGSITAILLGVPGTPASIATVWDGHKMTKNGEAAKALNTAISASTIGGLLSAFALLFLSPYLAKITLLFGPPEYVALAIWGLAIICSLESKSLVNGLISGCLGLLLATVGMSPVTGTSRFTFGQISLSSGIEIIPTLIGLFCIPEIISLVEEKAKSDVAFDGHLHLKDFFKQFKETCVGTSLRAGIIGVIIGIIPGAGGTIAPFITYNDAKNRSKTPEKFGTGHMPGVASSEAANNGASCSSLVPLLTLGVPGSSAAVVFLGALTIHGLQPGSLLFEKQPDIVYGLLVGSVIIQLYMLVVGLFGAPWFAKTTKIPNAVLISSIFVFSCIGAYANNNNMFNVWVMLAFGFIGYAMKKVKLSPAAMVLAMILGPIFEKNMIRSLAISYGSWSIFFTRPICIVFYVLTIIMVAGPMRKALQVK